MVVLGGGPDAASYLGRVYCGVWRTAVARVVSTHTGGVPSAAAVPYSGVAVCGLYVAENTSVADVATAGISVL